MSACHLEGKPPPERANATWAGGVSGQAVELGNANDTAVCAWQQGLDSRLIEAVLDYRRARPLEQLPADFQRTLARLWIAYAKEHAR